jgi:hypothetical protein
MPFPIVVAGVIAALPVCVMTDVDDAPERAAKVFAIDGQLPSDRPSPPHSASPTSPPSSSAALPTSGPRPGPR